MAYFNPPTVDELRPLNQKYGFRCTEEELEVYSGFLKRTIKAFHRVYELPEPIPPVKYVRDGGYRPPQEENPLNAWYWKCSIKGAESGPLSGKKICLKDTVFLAGIPMMNGSRVLEGFTPDYDATVVSRLLDAGAEIVGKSTCEDLSFSGGTWLTYGAVKNPWNTNYSAGGSSGGSAALVASGGVDMAIGSDQSGSIRIPSCINGCAGIKPTHGLVPYTGCAPIETTFDHVGPICKTVRDCAAMLNVIAGFDNNADNRQPSNGFEVPQDYLKQLDEPTTGLKVGVVEESFPVCNPDVQATVKKAVEAMKSSGKFALVEEFSLPHHLDACDAAMVLWNTGACNQMIDNYGYNTGVSGQLSQKMADAMFRGIKTEAHTLSHAIKMTTMFASYFKDTYGLGANARANSLRLHHRKLYNEALEKYDVLIFPTLPSTGCELISKETPLFDQIYRSFNYVRNTSPFNACHHPAMTLNAGFSDDNGLPIGIMVVGKHWHDGTVLQVGNAIEEIVKPFQTITCPTYS